MGNNSPALDELSGFAQPAVLYKIRLTALELSDGHTGFQSQCDLRSGLSMRHVPAFRLAPRLVHAAGLLVIGMNLHREFLVRKEKLQQQRKAPRIAGSVPYDLTLVFLAKVSQSPPAMRSIRYFAIVSGKPSLANFFLEFMIGIYRRQIICTPRAGIESRTH